MTEEEYKKLMLEVITTQAEATQHQLMLLNHLENIEKAVINNQFMIRELALKLGHTLNCGVDKQE